MISFNQYIQHTDEGICEWIAGAVEILPPLCEAELRVRDALLEMLGGYAEENGAGLVIPAPFCVRMPEEMQRGREPDLLYVPNQFAETVQDNYVNSHGVALVIEICDHRTRHNDHTEKMSDYEMAGIPEYWIVDVGLKQLEFFVLFQGKYHVAPLVVDGSYLSFALKGFALDLGRVWV
jgi:Uma2 family endonuclease